jgi:hypothetical protein
MDDLSLLRDWLIIGAGRSWTLVGSLPGAELVKEAKDRVVGCCYQTKILLIRSRHPLKCQGVGEAKVSSLPSLLL